MKQLTEEKESGRDDHETLEPKEGKIDADNAPHVGGNTWMGGTGEWYKHEKDKKYKLVCVHLNI